MSTVQKKVSPLTFVGLLAASGLALLQCSRSLLVTATKASGAYSYSPEAALVVQESLKLLISWVLYLSSGADPSAGALSHVLANKKACLMYAIPALIYGIQNSIVFYALLYINPPTFQLFTQLKIVTTALAYRFYQKRPLTSVQWCAVLLLLVATVLGRSKGPAPAAGDDGPSGDATIIGLGMSLLYCVLSTISGTVREQLLKGSDMPMPFQNVVLYTWAVFFNLLSAWCFAPEVLSPTGLVEGFGVMAWVVIINGAILGHITAAVAKYADNLVSAFAAAISLFLSTGLSVFFFGTQVTLLFFLGLCLTIISLFLYFGPHNAVLLAARVADANAKKVQ